VYTFIRPPRTNPISVWLLSRANRTARLLGADTATTIGTRPASAFCMISKLDRPLTSTTCRSSGYRSRITA
jgi:hypothetical protein